MINRRPFLRGLGGTMLCLPSLQLFSDGKKTAQVPKRLVCIGTHFGFVPKLFFPEDFGENYKPSFLLKETNSLRHKYSVFSNLDHGVEAIGGHGGIHAFLTGILSKNSKSLPEKNISLDQKAVQIVGAKTRFPSMQLSTDNDAGNSAMSWNNSGVALISETKIINLYQKLFQISTKANRELSKKLSREKLSVIDLARTDANILESKIGKEDQQTLDQYFTSIRQLEKKVQQDINWIDQPKPIVGYKVDPNIDQQDFINRVPVYYDLMKLALQTDSTRVMTFMSSFIGKNLGGLPITKGYHQLTHHGQVESYINELSIIEKFHMQQFNRFMQSMEDIMEPNGKTLLDNTITLFGSGMGNASSHSNRKLPLLVAGGDFKHGFHYDCKLKNGKNDQANKLYTTLLNKFGMNLDSFNQVNGQLPGFSA